MKQEQFLNVISVEEAHHKFNAAVPVARLDAEIVATESALGRIVAEDIVSSVNVPSFDRSNFDGFAVRAADTIGADETRPVSLRIAGPPIVAGQRSDVEIKLGEAIGIATGAMIPRGADSIVMIEYSNARDERVQIFRPTFDGFGVSFTGSDIATGQTIIFDGTSITSRETGTIAAIGQTRVLVTRRPRVAVISTGNEIIAPGQPMVTGLVYDSNSRILCDAAREIGAEAYELGIAIDELRSLRELVQSALTDSDLVILSGGTSKGPDDLSFRIVSEFDDPGIVVHGVAVKPGKPVCLAATQGKPVIVLPGFPTSAIFMFHEFVKPLICKLAGRHEEKTGTLSARLSSRVNSSVGRTEFNLVRIVSNEANDDDLSQPPATAFSMGKGSGSVTNFSHADGFFRIDRNTEFVEAGQIVEVNLLNNNLPLSDLVIVGSHCIGLDRMVGELHRRGFVVKQIHIGSTAGLESAKKGWCDLAGIHLLEPESGRYNLPFLDKTVDLIQGYFRRQGIVVRSEGSMESLDDQEIVERVATDDTLMMINRNAGSGTRILIEQLLDGNRPPGYSNAVSNHHAVAAAVAQGRADWGVCISAAADSALRFVRLADEKFDFVLPKSRIQLPAIVAFREVLSDDTFQKRLAELGYEMDRAKDKPQ